MNFNKFQKISIGFISVASLFFVICFLFFVNSVFAQPTAVFNPQYPWEGVTTPEGLVGSFYKTSLGIVAALAFGVLIYGAILYSVSGAVSTQQDAREWISGALWGLVLLLAAYLILYTINPVLVGQGVAAVAPPAPTLTPTPKPNASQEISRNLYLNPKVEFSKNSDCKPHSAATSIEQLVVVGSATACSISCVCSQKVSVDSKLLQAVQDLSNNYNKVTVTSITTGRHSSNSLHYQGKAIDIDVAPDKREEVVNFLKAQGFNAFCDKNGKAVSCNEANHIHYSI